MLKIKDNVDFKELEKFGFIKMHMEILEKEIKIKDFPMFKNVKHISIRIDYTKHIGKRKNWHYYRRQPYCFDNELGILYDLIKADLVEKI